MEVHLRGIACQSEKFHVDQDFLRYLWRCQCASVQNGESGLLCIINHNTRCYPASRDIARTLAVA